MVNKLWVFVMVISLVSVSSVGIADEMHKHHQQMGESKHNLEDEETPEQSVGICPVRGNPATEEYSYTYEGKTYYFCCPMCVEEFKKNPDKYISKIKEINLQAYQFGFSPDKITVKKGDIVRIYATSADVPHGFYIKEYGINVPLKKGKIQKIEFVADKEGEFDIRCSIYCGRGHYNMKAKLIVQE